MGQAPYVDPAPEKVGGQLTQWLRGPCLYIKSLTGEVGRFTGITVGYTVRGVHRICECRMLRHWTFRGIQKSRFA